MAATEPVAQRLCLREGMGSTLHVAAMVLAQALHYDHILLWDPDGEHVGEEYADPGCGRGENYTNWDCIFEPLSSCGAEHVAEHNSVRFKAFAKVAAGPLPWSRGRIPEHWEMRLQAHWALRGVAVTGAYLKVWWRSQAVAYIVRPNTPTMSAILALRMNGSLNHVWQNGQPQPDSAVPYPLTPGTISMHVRHGDKGKEMNLVPFESYVRAAKKMVAQNPVGLKRIAFVSSEDPSVIEEASKLTRIAVGISLDEWCLVYTSDLHRMNSGPIQQLELFKTRSAKTAEWLYKLFMAIEADVFIGTRDSNWNCLIDETRCTAVDKCDSRVC